MMIQGLDRSLNDSLSQLTRKHETKQTRFRCVVKRVNIVRHMVDVTGRNYAGNPKVKVSTAINMGTPDRPQVFAGDIAWIERQPDNKWLCVEIRNKTHCATSTESDVELDSTADTQNSYSAQGSYGLTLTPLDLMLPPIEQLGQLTPLDQRFTPSCELPFCTICAPNGIVAGMTKLVSADDDHPDGCFIYGFRCGACSGSPVIKSQIVYGNVTSPLLGQVFWVLYPYIIAVGANTDQTNSYATLTNVAVPATPTLDYSRAYDDGNPADQFAQVGAKDMWFFHQVEGLSTNLGVVMTPQEISVAPSPYAGTYNFNQLAVVTTPSPGLSINVTSFFIGNGYNDITSTPVVSSDSLPGWLNGYTRPRATIGSDFYEDYIVTDVHGGASGNGFLVAYNLVDPLDALSSLVNASFTTFTNEILVWDLAGYANTDTITWYGIDDSGLLSIYDLSNPFSPSLLGTLAGAASHASDCRIDSVANILWVVDDNDITLVGIDVSTPASPSILSTTSLDNTPKALLLCDGFAAIATLGGNVEEYDISTPATPTLSGSATFTDFTPAQRMLKGRCGTLYVLGKQVSTSYGMLGIVAS